VRITPSAAPGSSFQALNPGLSFDPNFTVGQAVTTATSPDGNTLLVLTSGYNSQNFTSGPNKGNTNPDESNEYIFVFDIAGGKPLQTQVLQVPNALTGSPSIQAEKSFTSVAGRTTTFTSTIGTEAAGPRAVAPVKLGHPAALALGTITPGAMGLAVTADGKRLVVANYENDSISLLDIAGCKVLAELDLRPGNGVAGGEYPVWVAVQGSSTAFVSSARDREILVVDISTNSPAITNRISVKGQPTRIALNPQQTRLYVAESSSDSVAVINTKTDQIIEEIGTTAPNSVFPNNNGVKGSSPNSVAVSADGQFLYVTNGGANSVAVIHLAHGGDEESAGGSGGGSELLGLIPTGWYPNSVSVSADGAKLYVVNGKSNTGPVPQNCTDVAGATKEDFSACGAANQYVWQLTKAGFLTLPGAAWRSLGRTNRTGGAEQQL